MDTQDCRQIVIVIVIVVVVVVVGGFILSVQFSSVLFCSTSVSFSLFVNPKTKKKKKGKQRKLRFMATIFQF